MFNNQNDSLMDTQKKLFVDYAIWVSELVYIIDVYDYKKQRNHRSDFSVLRTNAKNAIRLKT